MPTVAGAGVVTIAPKMWRVAQPAGAGRVKIVATNPAGKIGAPGCSFVCGGSVAVTSAASPSDGQLPPSRFL